LSQAEWNRENSFSSLYMELISICRVFLFSHAVRRISILQSKNIELPERQYIELMLMQINISISTKGKISVYS